MADPLMLAEARPTRFVRPGDGAAELIGRSPAIVRVQELIRRGAALDGGALITAEAGAGVEAVARELHQRGARGGGALRRRALRRRAIRRASIACCSASCAGEAPTDLESVGADSSDRRGARRHAVPARRHRAARVGAGAAGADRARRRGAHRRRAGGDRRCASSPARSRASTPTSTPTASAPISTAACRPCASTCRRCAIGPTMCRRWRCGCWKMRARRRTSGAHASRRRRSRCSAR